MGPAEAGLLLGSYAWAVVRMGWCTMVTFTFTAVYLVYVALLLPLKHIWYASSHFYSPGVSSRDNHISSNRCIPTHSRDLWIRGVKLGDEDWWA